jgi:hypothetical protein
LSNKQRLIAWLVIVLGMTVCRIGFLENVIYNIDEAEYAVAADGLDHGWLPGVDLLGSTKPPGISVLFNLLFHTFGRSMAVIHAAHLLIMIAAGFLLVELAISLWGLPAAVPSAMLYWMFSNSWNLPHEIIGLNVESPAIVFTLVALVLAWKWPRSIRWLFVSGLCVGIATVFRQSIGALVLPIAAVTFFDRERRAPRLIAILAGMLIPWIPVVAVYASHGALGWAWDSWVRYPMTYASDLGIVGFLDALYLNTTEFSLASAVPLAMAAGGMWILWKERQTPRFKFLLWLAIGSALALSSGSRFFGHYWIQVFPLLALLGVPAWFVLAKGSSKAKLLLGAAVAVGSIVAFVHFPMWRTWDRFAPPAGQSFFRVGTEQTEKKLGDFARANTNPDETIAVWGYCPQIYWHADRLPGVRDYLCHYITGYSPGSFDPFTQRAIRPYGHPLAQKMFVDDLERRKPKYIFDLVQITDYTFTFYKYSLRTYPELAEYIRKNYLPEGEIDKALIYRRRTSTDTWWPEQEDVQ